VRAPQKLRALVVARYAAAAPLARGSIPRAATSLVRFDRARYVRPGAVKQQSLLRLGDLQEVTNLVRLQPLDVVKNEDRFLGEGQLVDGGLHCAAGPAIERQFLGGVFGPLGRRIRPSASRVESLRLDRPIAGCGGRGEWSHLAIWQRAGLRPRHEDPKDPRPERGASIESAYVVEHPEPGVLDESAGRHVVIGEKAREAEERAAMARNESCKGVALTGADPPEELAVLDGPAVARFSP
jgi:hypothetical protein